MKDEWQVKFNISEDGQRWELAVVKSSNYHGIRSLGWFDENKLMISSNSECVGNASSLDPVLRDMLISAAKAYAEHLNQNSRSNSL
jgi:hypothetical protein